ncbi:YqhG family protein [Lysinibacillus odysseyi]|uniref:YqhG n=1 Tax=Lysinibacillus odysseyi 34hs-1 = NBRC 100172 TaxID=1220589 RepID=A0A0A3IIM2_9BACI|nr:YqhG family protein [Lysinibacillus odysseyi]KGR82673.1 hypothetical protein CD32_17620 [Lysinibacillus odysseyi 34hs-1 = NBRC 100172]
MYPQQVHDYLQTFFQETNCPILTEHPYYMVVQLTEEMDKKIMNRPFYWQYVESAGIEPAPLQLTLVTDRTKLQEDINGEMIHFGSPRLNRLFEATKELGAFVKLYEYTGKGNSMTLTPWLGVNYKVSYYCHHTKEMLYSLGINLLTGQVVENFQERLKTRNLQSSIPADTFAVPYIIKPARALDRLDVLVEEMIIDDDHSWAKAAEARWLRDLEVLEYFYIDSVTKPESYELEKKALEEQYTPRIKVDMVNGGLFYLS